MPTRFDRTLPWGILLGILIVMMLGLSWDASFEATPANTDLASEGDDRIRELKVEIADRGEDELCWGTGATSGCPGSGDNGFLREGAARAFFATANPTTLNDAATTALGAGHDGRIYFDDDGADNVDANNDDNQIKVWNGSAWQAVRWESLGGITLTGLANGDIFRYNGTVIVNSPAPALLVRDSGTFANNETFTNGTCAVDCTVTDVPDHTGGTHANGYPLVTAPATPTGTLWNFRIFGFVTYTFTSSNAGTVQCEIEYDTTGGVGFGSTATMVGMSMTNNNGDFRTCQFDAAILNVVAGTAIAARVKMTDSAGTADWDVDSTTLPAGLNGENHITIEARPNSLF